MEIGFVDDHSKVVALLEACRGYRLQAAVAVLLLTYIAHVAAEPQQLSGELLPLLTALPRRTDDDGRTRRLVFDRVPDHFVEHRQQ